MIEAALIGYLLFIVPGFFLIWTYRHFIKAGPMGEFEYAVWSLFWGTLFLMATFKISQWLGRPFPEFKSDNAYILLASYLGAGLGISIGGSFPVGFFAAIISRRGYFLWLDQQLFKLMDRLVNF